MTETGSVICWLTLQMPAVPGLNRLKSRARKSTQGSHIGSKNPLPWLSSMLYQELHWQEAGIRYNGWKLNSDTSMQGPGVLNHVITGTTNTTPYFQPAIGLLPKFPQ